MIIKRNQIESDAGLKVAMLELASHTQYFLTAPLEDPLAAFAETAAMLADNKIQPFQEKVYGQAEAREKNLAFRAAAYAKHGLDAAAPVTYVDGRPPSGAEFGGVSVWGLSPRTADAPSIATLEVPGLAPGRCWTGSGYRMAYFPRLRGADAAGKLADCPTCQARRMFANAVEGLNAHGFSYNQTVRTWIYMARILDWYGEFNKVRTEVHVRQGMVRDGVNSRFPASTGIQGKHAPGEECFMDLLAVDGRSAVGIEPILGSERQPPAFTYGSGFSRGMTLTMEGRKIVLISGTASTNARGKTIHVDDPEAQCLETLLSIGAILKGQGGSLDNICTSTLFCKHPKILNAYRNVQRLLGLHEFPAIPMLADVCRPDWLVEIEAIALI